MRKKIFLLLVFLVSFMGFGIDARAEAVDHSLNYDIEKFELSDNNILTIEGWGFIHNYDNYGYGTGVESYYSNNINRSLNESAALHLYFYFRSGNSIVGKNFDGSYAEEVSFIVGSDFTYDMCYKGSDTNQCVGNSYVYKNLKFKINIDLNKYFGIFNSGSNYSLYLLGRLGNVEKEVEVAVAEGVTNKTATEMFEISKLSNKIDVSGNHIIFSGSDFWRLTSNDSNLFYYGRRGKTKSGDYYDYILYYGDTLCVDGSAPRNGWDCSTTKFGPGDYLIGCGWNFDGKIDSPNGDGAHYTTRKCIQPSSSESDNYKIISARFVNVIGSVKIKFKGSSDHVCNISNGTLNACTGGSIENNCSMMTVYDDEKNISAVVSIKESSNITPGEDADYIDNYNSYFGIDYSKYNIVKGKTFHYALTYTNTASWSFVEKNYGNVFESDGDKVIRDKMKDYYKEINKEDFAAKVSIKSNDREEFNAAGIWDCKEKGGTKKEFASGSTTLICKYNLKYLYIDGNGEDTYGDILKNSNGDELTLGRNFYIPLSYEKDKFTWEVNSSSSLNTVKVRTNKDVKTPNSSLLAIDIISSSSSDDNNQCSIKIIDSNDVPDVPDGNYSGDSSGDSSGDPGYNFNSEYVDDKLYVYRTVDVNNPFPDGYIPKNWNNKDFIKRLKSSYDNLQKPDYETVPMTAKIINSVREIDTVYTSWEDTITSGSDNSGSNNFVSEHTYFNTIYSGKHCKYGLYNSKCDERVW